MYFYIATTIAHHRPTKNHLDGYDGCMRWFDPVDPMDLLFVDNHGNIMWY